MPSFIIPLEPLAAQSFNAQLGDNLVRFRIQWMTRFDKFRMDMYASNGQAISEGRILHPGIDLFAGIYPPGVSYGRLMMVGDLPTPDNLGIDNQLVWSNG